MKYSIVIVAYKAEADLLKCLESLNKNPPPEDEAEIILIDNSPEPIHIPNTLIKSLCWKKYVRVILVQEGVNRGFAEGCNEGVRQSHGEYVVLVNPDTVVFPGWAERMAAHFGPKVGAVGPISNFVAGYQQYVLHMQRAEGWDKVAKLAAKGLNKRGVATKLLIGFFLMIPRKVWNEMGGLDTAFFLGCDDLDLSLRLRDAGYELIIASDVFVYHEGHSSFYAAGGEASMTLNKQSEKAMLAKLNAKYGDNIPTSTELWGCEILPTLIPKRMTLSVCMIVRGEGKNLSVLMPQLGFADEIVLVETGGEEDVEAFGYMLDRGWVFEGVSKAPEIRFGLKSWCDDFSAARNFALSKCTGDYVLWLDADDRVPAESAALIRAAMDHPGPLTQQQKCHFAIRLRDHTPEGRFASADQPRLFPRIPGLEWEGRVHESYMAKADALGLKLVSTQITIDHTGYRDPAVLAQKHARNLRLLHMEPDSPLKFYQIGGSLSGLGRFREAREFFHLVLDREWEKPLAHDFADQVRFRIAWDLYKEHGDAVPEMIQYIEANEKPDALYFRAELALMAMDLERARDMYALYASYGPIMDFYGCDQELFTSLCQMRLDMLERILELPEPERPAVIKAIRESRGRAAEVAHG